MADTATGPGLRDLLPSVASCLGVPGFDNPLGAPASSSYVVVVVDGLGTKLLHENAPLAPFLAELPGVDGVLAGVPSTTATSLTSLGTGLDTGEHGVVGYTCRNPQTGRRMNSLTWDSNVDPRQWQPYSNVLEQVQAAGIWTAVVNDAAFESSGLTQCSARGVPFYGVHSTWERHDVIATLAEEHPRSLIYAYEPRLDHTGHRYGCQSVQWREMLSRVDADLAALRRELPAETAMVVTADHGMLDLALEDRFDMDTVPALRDDVTLVAGEARLRHLYTRSGRADSVAQRWRAELGDRAEVRTQAEAEEWFGPIASRVAPRIGDVVVASRGDFAVFSAQDFAIEFQMVGFHGSITLDERAVPVLLAR